MLCFNRRHNFIISFRTSETLGTALVTFRALLSALNKYGKPDKALYYLKSMANHGLTPKIFHYGCVIDAYARTAIPQNVQQAVKIFKGSPIRLDEQAIHCIFSQCVPPQFASQEVFDNAQLLITILKDFALYLEK